MDYGWFSKAAIFISAFLFGMNAPDLQAREQGKFPYNTGAIAVDGDFLWIGSDDGVVRLDMTDGSNIRFRKTEGLASSRVSAIVVESPGVLWFGTNSGVTRYDGESWKRYTTADGLIYNVVLSAAMDRDGSVWFGTESGVSHFDGKIWTGYTVADGLAMNSVRTIAISPDGVKWFGNENLISRFDGKNWTTFKLFEFTDDSPSIRVMHCDAAGMVWVGLNGPLDGFVMGYDGVSWQEYKDMGVHLHAANSLDVGPENIKWFYSHLRLIRYDGKEWTAFQADGDILPSDCPGMAADRYGRIWLVSGKGVVRFDNGSWTMFPFDLKSEVFGADDHAMHSPALLPASPNPFNASTLLRFTLPSSGYALLEIRDISGRLVRTLAAERLPAGQHAISWDGRDGLGQPVASGVYLPILRVGGNALAGRMLLLK